MLFDAAVLTGGASTRMGTDKAVVEVDGAAMAWRVAQAMHGAAASTVFCVGGDGAALRALGLGFVDDDYAGDGPLGGIVTALRAAAESVVVIAPCDMPWIASGHVTRLVRALDADRDADVAHSEQHLFAAWRTRSLKTVEEVFDAGERAPKRALVKLRSLCVELPAGPWSADVDTPDDLA